MSEMLVRPRLEAVDVRVISALSASPVVEDVSFSLAAGRAIGIAGESGCGKTSLVQSLFGYARQGLHIEGGRLALSTNSGRDGGGLSLPLAQPQAFRGVVGRAITLVPQSANSVFDPLMRIGDQLNEVTRTVKPASKTAMRDRIRTLLKEVGFPDPDRVTRLYPHQLSGGQRQRVALCLALIPEPDVLVLDEATTDLDVITQDRILGVVQALQGWHGFSLIVVSHDLRVLARLCQDVLIMYAGTVVEAGPLPNVFASPTHPYTATLLARFEIGPTAAPTGGDGSEQRAAERSGSACRYLHLCPIASEKCVTEPTLLTTARRTHSRCWLHAEVPERLGLRASEIRSAGQRPPDEPVVPNAPEALLQVTGLSASYRTSGLLPQRVPVLHNVGFSMSSGETLGIVGESGSGKTTLARILVGLHTADSGTVNYRGARLEKLPARQRSLDLQREIQIIFQNPEGAFNPKHSVVDVLGRRIRRFEQLDQRATSRRVEELLDAVGLPANYVVRFPDQLSGGEKQRLAIARALIGHPKLIVCDEVVSSLDVVAQGRVIRLLKRIQDQTGVAYVFISHDLPLVADVAETVVVMRSGEVCEFGPAHEVLRNPRQEYTRQLVAAGAIRKAGGTASVRHGGEQR